jgi:hypothetical protein
MMQNPATIDRKKTAMGAESSFSLTRQAQTNHYDRRILRLFHNVSWMNQLEEKNNRRLGPSPCDAACGVRLSLSLSAAAGRAAALAAALLLRRTCTA